MRHHAAYVFRAGCYFVNSPPQLVNPHLTGEELRDGGDAWSGLREEVEAERRIELPLEVNQNR